LQQNGNNILQTAESLQMSRSTLYRKIKEYGIKTGQ
jgi:transcriptional regulator of acetoin/glycerol metabolism